MSVARWLTWEPPESEFPDAGWLGTDRTDRKEGEGVSGSCVSGNPGSSRRKFPALALPVAVISVADELEPEARWPHKIVVDARRPVTGPLGLNGGTTVVDRARAVEADLGSLAMAVRGYSAACGDPTRQGEAEEHAGRIEELIEQPRGVWLQGARSGVVLSVRERVEVVPPVAFGGPGARRAEAEGQGEVVAPGGDSARRVFGRGAIVSKGNGEKAGQKREPGAQRASAVNSAGRCSRHHRRRIAPRLTPQRALILANVGRRLRDLVEDYIAERYGGRT